MSSDGSTYTSTHNEGVLSSYNQYRTATNCAPHLLNVLQPAHTILDVGCGPGSISVDLASRVPQGHVTGVDVSPVAVQKANDYAASKGVKNCTFTTADIYSLSFPDSSFDIVHVHQVLQHIGHPVKALIELKRVLKPDGYIACSEADFGGCFWYPDIPGLRRWKEVYPRVQKANGGEPDGGRMLHTWFIKAGFSKDQLNVTGGNWCFSTKEDVAIWEATWTSRLVLDEFKQGSVGRGFCEEGEPEEMAAAWKEWGRSDEAWFFMPHGRVLAKK